MKPQIIQEKSKLKQIIKKLLNQQQNPCYLYTIKNNLLKISKAKKLFKELIMLYDTNFKGNNISLLLKTIIML